MAYNPGIQPIGGQLIGQGIAQGLGGLAQGIMQRAAKRREKEQPLLDQMAPEAGVRLDKDLPKEAIPQVIQIAGHIEQQKREAPLQELRIENEKLRQRISQGELDSAAAHAAALQAAAPALQAGDARGAFAAYTAKGGSDPRTLAELGGLAMQQERNQGRPKPGLVNFGLDAHGRPVEGLVDAQGNVSRIAPPAEKEAKPSDLARLIAERDDFAKAGRADVVKEYDRVIGLYGSKSNGLLGMLAGDVAEAPAARPAASPLSSATPAAPSAAPQLTEEDQQALAWARANPADPRAAAILSRLGAQ
jgi:hypothetical protein